jgi:large subunit ribosomal protein L35
MKTNRGAAKRFRRTKSGLFKRGKSLSGHNFTCKTRKRKRRLRQITYVAPSDVGRVSRLLPNS